MSESSAGDGLNAFELNRAKRQQEEIEKAIRRGIALAQTAPESTEIINNYAAAIVDTAEPERCALQICMPSGRQIRVVMGPAVQVNIGDELAARRGRALLLDGAGEALDGG